MGKILIYVAILEGCLTYIFQLNMFLELDLYSMFFIGINSIVLYFLLARESIPKWLFCALYISYFCKILWLIFMYFNIPKAVEMFHVWDVFGFHFWAIEFLSNPNAAGIEFYSKVVACLYAVFGENMRIPVYYNILFSLYAELMLYKILTVLNLKRRTIYFFTILYILLPWKALMSLYLMREAIPSFLIILGLYFFILWIKNGRNKHFIYCFISSTTALLFHSGLLPFLIVYSIFYMVYDVKQKKVCLSKKAFFRMAILCVFSMVFSICFGEALIAKFLFLMVELPEEKISAWSRYWTEDMAMRVDSLYLTWLPYNTISDIFLQSPLRAFYFLYSPLPWDFRGIKDVLAFSIDSMVQISCMLYIIRNSKYVQDEYKTLLKLLFFAFILNALVFGAGTFGSGTALRHRAKFVSVLVLMSAIVYDKKIDYRQYMRKN